jgi:hypothetical protein
MTLLALNKGHCAGASPTVCKELRIQDKVENCGTHYDWMQECCEREKCESKNNKKNKDRYIYNANFMPPPFDMLNAVISSPFSFTFMEKFWK